MGVSGTKPDRAGFAKEGPEMNRANYLATGGEPNDEDDELKSPRSASKWSHFSFVLKSPLGGLFLVVYFEVSGTSLIMPVFQYFCQMDLRLSAVWVGLLFSAYNGVRILAAPINGRLSDVAGRRCVLLVCFFASSLALVIMSLVNSFTQVLWVMIFFGLASSGNLPISVAVVADCADPDERPSLIGLLFAVGNFGMVLSPVLLVMALYLDLLSRRTAFLVGGIVCFIGFALGFCILRESLPTTKRRPLQLSANMCDCQGGDCSRVGGALISIWSGGFFVSMTFMILVTTYALLINLAFGYSDIAYGIIMAFGGILGATCQVVLLPFLAPWLGRHWIAILGNLVMAVSVGLLPLSTMSVYVHFCVLGALIVGMACVDAAMPDLVTAYAPSERDLGFAQGVANALKALGCVVAPLTAGVLWEYAYQLPFYMGTACSIIAAILVTIAWFYGSSAPEEQQERLMGSSQAAKSRGNSQPRSPSRTPPQRNRHTMQDAETQFSP